MRDVCIHDPDVAGFGAELFNELARLGFWVPVVKLGDLAMRVNVNIDPARLVVITVRWQHWVVGRRRWQFQYDHIWTLYGQQLGRQLFNELFRVADVIVLGHPAIFGLLLVIAG